MVQERAWVERGGRPWILATLGLGGIFVVVACVSPRGSFAPTRVSDSILAYGPAPVLQARIAVGSWQGLALDAVQTPPGSTPQPGGPPSPTVSVTPIAAQPLPLRAYVSGVSSYPQTLGLDCEARSAVDWAAFWGKSIDELGFFYGIPRSDDPQMGFVGDPNGSWGQVPPQAYGVYAGPVAALLRDYGVPAQAEVGLRFDDLRAEIAAGRPVILWVAGHVRSGTPEPYTASDGTTSVVTPYEHTVLLYGYDPTSVEILDEGRSYRRSLADFLLSWSTLNNMAVVRPALADELDLGSRSVGPRHGVIPWGSAIQ